MKKSLLFALVLATICLMPSCKKHASEIAFGDTVGMLVSTYDSTDMKVSLQVPWERYYDIDLDSDGSPDIQLLSRNEGSPNVGRVETSYIKCLNENLSLLGDIFLQDHYVHYDTIIQQYDDETWIITRRTFSCEKQDESDVIEKTEEKLSLWDADAGETFGLANDYMSTEVTLIGHSYTLRYTPEEVSPNLIIQSIDIHDNNSCDYYPFYTERYIGFKFNINGRDHLGWMKIILEERLGDYFVKPIESAIQK